MYVCEKKSMVITIAKKSYLAEARNAFLAQPLGLILNASPEKEILS